MQPSQSSLGILLALLYACACTACGDEGAGGDEQRAPIAGGGSGGAAATSAMQPVGMAGSAGSAAAVAPVAGGPSAMAGMSGAAGGTAGGSAAGSAAAAGSGGAPVVDGGVDSGPGMPMTNPGAALDESKALIPHASWPCGMPEGMPAPKSGTLVFESDLMLGDVHDLGLTQYGERSLIEVDGGALKGPRIEGNFLGGGLELQLGLSNGAQEIEGVHILRTNDGAAIYLRTCGTAPGAGHDTRFTADFEAGNSGRYAWLNTAKLVGTRTFDHAAKTLHYALYEIAAAMPAGADAVRVMNPDGVEDQSWECAKGSGTRGATVYMETVGIGGSISVGASKRGTRNIIPITGGTFSGRLKGTILAGGADYQLIGSGFELDARYTLRTDDGQLIIVRNCGAASALIPVFEARADGPYAWLNANEWLSSSPSVTIGAVNLTIYERQ